MLQPASFECNPQPSTATVTTFTTSTQTVSTQTATTVALIPAFPTMLHKLAVTTDEFINASSSLNVSELPRFWPILAPMVVLLLGLCVCLACFIRGSNRKLKRHHDKRRTDSWTSSGDESDMVSDLSENEALAPKNCQGKHNLGFAHASELVAHDISNQDTAATAATAAAAAAAATSRQHLHLTPP